MRDRDVLDDRAAQRIAAIAALIQSNHDGEALAACRALVAALDRHGLRIADVILVALAAPAEDADYWWQACACDCLDSEPFRGCWSDRTRDFLHQMTKWPREPSPAQRAWLNNCAALVRDARAAS